VLERLLRKEVLGCFLRGLEEGRSEIRVLFFGRELRGQGSTEGKKKEDVQPQSGPGLLREVKHGKGGDGQELISYALKRPWG